MEKNGNRTTELRRQTVAELFYKGYSSRVIAEKLHKFPLLETLHWTTVARDIATIKKEVQLAHETEINNARALSIARMRQIQRHAWEDYENSFGLAWQQRPRFLQIIKDCEKQIVELEGTMSPTKVEFTERVEVIEKVKDYGGFSSN